MEGQQIYRPLWDTQEQPKTIYKISNNYMGRDEDSSKSEAIFIEATPAKAIGADKFLESDSPVRCIDLPNFWIDLVAFLNPLWNCLSFNVNETESLFPAILSVF